jgi:hypothetical protein
MQAGEEAGEDLAFVDDVTGDGVGDLLVSAPNHDEGALRGVGATYVVAGE